MYIGRDERYQVVVMFQSNWNSERSGTRVTLYSPSTVTDTRDYVFELPEPLVLKVVTVLDKSP